jgi:hypothetical protein
VAAAAALQQCARPILTLRLCGTALDAKCATGNDDEGVVCSGFEHSDFFIVSTVTSRPVKNNKSRSPEIPKSGNPDFPEIRK